MPSPVAHSLMGYCYYRKENSSPAKNRADLKKLFWFVLFTNLPDLHYIPEVFLGIPYRFTYSCLHSPVFALTVSLTLFVVLEFTGEKERSLYWAAHCFALYCLHLLLDYFCLYRFDPGIPLLWPFSEDTFTAPVHLFMELRKGSLKDMLVLENFYILGSEVLIFVAVAALLLWWERRKRRAIAAT